MRLSFFCGSSISAGTAPTGSPEIASAVDFRASQLARASQPHLFALDAGQFLRP